MGNNTFIDARSRVKTSFIFAIIATALSLLYINYYRVEYKMGLIFTHLFKAETVTSVDAVTKEEIVSALDYSNVFIDMVWLLNVIGLIATVALIAVIPICRFKWTSKYLVAIPAGVKLLCSAALVFILYTRNYKTIAAQEGVYKMPADTFLLLSIIYLVGMLLVFVSIFLPGKLLRACAFTGILLIAAVGALSFFLPSPYSIPYELLSLEMDYSYRALAMQVSEFVFLLSVESMASGLDVYHRCIKEDEEAAKNAAAEA